MCFNYKELAKASRIFLAKASMISMIFLTIALPLSQGKYTY